MSRYIYKGLGHKIDYVIDITKGYNNFLQKCEDNHTQTYLWDGNVAGMLDIEYAVYY